MFFCAAAGTGSRTLLFQTKFWRCFTIAGKKELEINEGIRDKEVRVIDADGTQLGIMSVRDAQKRADEKNLDLVKIAPQAQPPVCKILDYGKYRFELQKRDKEAKKNQKVVDVYKRQGKVFARETEQVWVCSNCGHVHIGTHAPEKCPVCDHPQGYFILQAKNY